MSFNHLHPDHLRPMLAQQTPILIDIRDPHSYAQGSLPGALRVDGNNLSDFLAAADFDRPLVVVCYHGNSSQPTADYFNQQGFDEVYSLDGGFELWQRRFPELVECPPAS